MSKKDKHARNQAKYMERKREASLEWLTEWVPESAHQAFKAIAKAARKSHGAPGEARLAEAAALATAQQGELPDWARSSEVLLSVWVTSTVAAAALDQLQAERDGTKGRKAEAKAAKSEQVPAAVEPTEPKGEATEPKAAPAKRTRKPAAATPADAVAPADTMTPADTVAPAEAVAPTNAAAG